MSQVKKNVQPKPVIASQSVNANRLQGSSTGAAPTEKEQQILLHEIEKELKAETPIEAAPLLEFVLKHVREITIGIVVCILLITVWGIWQWRSDVSLTNAKTEFQNILNTQDTTQRIAKLTAFLPNVPEELQIAVLLEQATAATTLQDYDKAAEVYLQIINIEKNSPLAITLQFSLADTLLQAGKAEAALANMEKFLVTAPANLQDSVIEQIAVLAEACGNNVRAIDAYQQLINSNKPELASSVSFYQTRIASLSEK